MTVQLLDLSVTGSSLVTSANLQTAVEISLLTWARARPDDTLADPLDLKGWWGDTYPDVVGDSTGSRLWTLWGRGMPTALALAPDMIAEALQWLIDDGIVVSIASEVEAVRPNMLGISVSLFLQNSNLAAQLDAVYLQLA